MRIASSTVGWYDLFSSDKKYRLGAIRNHEIGSIKIYIPLSVVRVFDVGPHVASRNVPFLLSQNVFIKLKALLKVGKRSLASPVKNWEVALLIVSEHLYIGRMATLLFTVTKLCNISQTFYESDTSWELFALCKPRKREFARIGMVA